jgi:hypothetical protein
MKHIFIFFFVACLVYSKNTSAQSNVSVKYFGLTVHPFGDYSADVQPYKLDKNAYLVANFGGYASYEKFIWIDMLSIKVKQGIFTDCSAGMMGVSHLGVQMNLLEKRKHKLSFGIGPTLIYRESWTRFPEYQESGFWNKYDSDRFGLVQYKMILYGCEFEYDYTVSDKTDLSVGFTPGFPFAFTFSFGVKYWFDKNFKTRLKLVTPKTIEK